VGTTAWSRGYQQAVISFDLTFYNAATPREMDLLITHELYHLMAAREDDRMEDLIGGESHVYKGYSKEQELIADTFSHAMVKAYARKKVE